MKKTSIFVLMAVIIVAVLAMVIPSYAKQPVIGVSGFGEEVDWPYFAAKCAVDEVERLGGKAIYTSANFDYNKQNNDILTLVRRRVDCIIIAGGGRESMREAANAAARARIPIVSVELFLESPTVMAEIASQEFLVGIRSGEYIVNRLRKKGGQARGNIVVFYQPGWIVVEERYKGFELVMKYNPGIKVIEQAGAGESGAAERVQAWMEAILNKYPKKGDIDGVWACWDGPAIGAAAAINAAGRQDEIFVVGHNGDRNTLDIIREGKSALKATVALDAPEGGRMAGELAMKVVKGEPVPKYVMLETELITKDNVHAVTKNQMWTHRIYLKDIPGYFWPGNVNPVK